MKKPSTSTIPTTSKLPLSDIICIIVWITVLVLGALSVPFFLNLEPTLDINPTFTLAHASVTGFNLTSDSHHLTSFFDILIKVNNSHDKTTLHFRGIQVSIYKNKHELALDVLDDFTLGQMNVAMLKAEPVALNVSLGNGSGFDFGLESGMGYVDFDVGVMVANVNMQTLYVSCMHVVVNITTATTGSSLYDFSSSPSRSNKFQSIDCSSVVLRL